MIGSNSRFKRQAEAPRIWELSGITTLFVVTILLWLAPPANASVQVTKGQIKITGDILEADLEPFFHALNPLPSEERPRSTPLHLVLNSGGGDLQTAFYMARLVEKARLAGQQITARVPVGGECNSACIVVFASAQERLAAPDARFMVHGLTYIGHANHSAVEVQRLFFTESYHQQIHRADPKFAGFIRRHRLIEDDLEMSFSGSVLFSAFDGFITALTPLEAS